LTTLSALEYASTGMGYFEVMDDVASSIEYYEKEDWLLFGFSTGSGSVNAGYQVYYNIKYWGTLYK